jgi:hypothetical protein
MKKLVKMLFCLVLPVVFLLTSAACSASGGSTGSLAVTDVTTSIGLAAGDTQTVYWSVVIQNKSSNTVFIELVEPVPSPGLEPKVLAGNLLRAVSKNVVSGQSVVVSGSFPFDARGMTKPDIDKLQPVVTGFRVIYDETLPVPGK